MTEIFAQILVQFGMATLFLTATGIGAIAVLRTFRCRAPFIHSAIWFLVLAQGILVYQFPIAIPWKVAISQQAPLSQPSVDLGTDSMETGSPRAATTGPSSGVPMTTPHSWNWPVCLAVVWLSGIVFLLGRWMIDYLRFVRSVDCERCDLETWNRQWNAIQKEHGVAKLFPLHISSNMGPFLYWTPAGYRIVVPFSFWHTLSIEQRETVLRHELAHYQRADVFKILFVHLLALPHWFNPMAWLATRRFESSIEWACDDVVCGSNPDGAAHYAKALLAIAELSSHRPTLASAVGGGGVSARIRRVLSTDTANDSRIKNALAFSLLAALLLLHGIRINLVAQEPKQPKEAEVAVTEEVAEKKKLPRQLTVEEIENSEEFKLMMQLDNYPFKHKTNDPTTMPDKYTESLALYGDKITDETLKQVAKMELKSLGLFQTRITGTGLNHLANQEKLEYLYLMGPQVTDRWLDNLPELPSLRYLKLTDSRITDRGLHNLERNPTIRYLILRNTNIGDVGLEVFQHLPVLTMLDLIHTQVSDAGLANLRHTPYVYWFWLASPNVKGPGLIHLQGLKEVGKIAFEGNNVTQEWMLPLEPLRDVYDLSLHKTQITDEGLSAIRNWSELERLRVYDPTITDESVAYLRQLIAAKDIHLTTQITPLGIQLLRDTLPKATIIDFHENERQERKRQAKRQKAR